MTPENVVQNQLDAYNSNNLEEFVACYSSDIEINDFDSKRPLMLGIEKLKSVYKELFDSSPDLESKVKQRITFDNKVIDHEFVTGMKGLELLEIVAIYEVNNNLITRVTFINKKRKKG